MNKGRNFYQALYWSGQEQFLDELQDDPTAWAKYIGKEKDIGTYLIDKWVSIRGIDVTPLRFADEARITLHECSGSLNLSNSSEALVYAYGGSYHLVAIGPNSFFAEGTKIENLSDSYSVASYASLTQCDVGDAMIGGELEAIHSKFRLITVGNYKKTPPLISFKQSRVYRIRYYGVGIAFRLIESYIEVLGPNREGLLEETLELYLNASLVRTMNTPNIKVVLDMHDSSFSIWNAKCADIRLMKMVNSSWGTANFSGASGIPSVAAIMAENFEFIVHPEHGPGYVVYRAQNGEFQNPDSWLWEEGAILREVPDLSPWAKCGAGVSFGTAKFVWKTYGGRSPETFWKAFIPATALIETIVPVNFDGKGRTSTLILLHRVEDMREESKWNEN